METISQPSIQIDQIFVSRSLFEHGPLALQMPLGEPIPEIRFDIQYRSGLIKNEPHRGAAALTLASVESGQAFYRIAVELTAYVSETPGGAGPELSEYLKAPLVATLYPFAREAIAALTSRGRHGAVYIRPFNVGALFPTTNAKARTDERGAKVAARRRKPARKK